MTETFVTVNVTNNRLAVGQDGDTVTITVLSGDTVYYGDRQVSAITNLGSLTVGQSLVVVNPTWLLSASLSAVRIDALPTAVSGLPLGPAGGKLSGTYPNPGLNAASTDLSDGASLAKLGTDGTVGGPSGSALTASVVNASSLAAGPVETTITAGALSEIETPFSTIDEITYDGEGRMSTFRETLTATGAQHSWTIAYDSSTGLLAGVS